MLRGIIKRSLILTFVIILLLFFTLIADKKLEKAHENPQALRAEAFFNLNQVNLVDKPIWGRETYYYAFNRYKNFGLGPDLSYNPAPVGAKILVIGDSYTWGYGLTEPSISWPRFLSEKLKNDGYKVYTLAAAGASFVEEVGWLTPEVIKKINPDLIVFAYMLNDVLPSGREAILCELGACLQDSSPNQEYLKCVAGDSLISDLIIRAGKAVPNLAKQALINHCDKHLSADTIPSNQFIADFKKEPRVAYTVPALLQLFRVVGDRKVLVVPYDLGPEQWAVVKEKVELGGAIAADYDYFLSSNTRPKIPNLAPSWCITEVDCHPGGLRNSIFADNLYSFLKSKNLINIYPPIDTSAKSVISHIMPHGQITIENNREVVTFSKEEGVNAQFNNVIYPLQYNPCALLDRPYNQISLNQNFLKKGIKVSIDDSKGYDFYKLSYDKLFNIVITKLAANQREVLITDHPDLKAVLYHESDGLKGCDLTKEISTTNVNATVEVLS